MRRLGEHTGIRALVCMALAGGFSILLGQDANWDLMNYHLYNPFSFFNQRFQVDFNAVGIQTYFNPTIDLPYYFLATRLFPTQPTLLMFLAGAPAGLLMAIVIELCMAAARSLPERGRFDCWFAAAFGLSGTVFWSEIGTTFGDIPMAILILGGLIQPVRLLSGARPLDEEAWARAWLVAGLLFGAAAGLKPTAVIFAPAAFLALLTAPLAWRARLTAGFLFCLGWGAAFLLLYGWWGWTLYQAFGNPIFPLMNQLFQSPWIPPISGTDKRFLPQGLIQTLFYPFYWLSGRPGLVTELYLRDGRFALAYLGMAALAVAALRRWRATAPPLPPLLVFLAWFFVISYGIWQALFSILRYALPLEALTGVIVLFGARRFLAGRRLEAALALCLIATIATSLPMNWGRLKTPGPVVFDIAHPPIPDGAVVVMADQPLGFVAPFLNGRDLSFVGVIELPAPGYRFFEEARRRIHAPRPAVVLINREPERYDALLAPLGLRIDRATCAPVKNDFQAGVQLCPATKDGS